MTEFDTGKFKKKLKKKIKKKVGGKSIVVKTSNGLYWLGALGAGIFYVSTATDFWAGVLGILKAIVWPAFLVYAALNNLHA